MMAVEGIEVEMAAVSAKRSVPAKIKGTKIYGRLMWSILPHPLMWERQNCHYTWLSLPRKDRKYFTLLSRLFIYGREFCTR